jgi:tetratricopeptide (TPR) repeat protein
MYGVWKSDADASRRKARLELIEFLLQKNARLQAQAELMNFVAALPPDPKLHLQAAGLFQQDLDYPDAFSQDLQVLRIDRGNAAAMAGAGEAAFRQGKYRTAERYLRLAVNTDSKDAHARDLLDSASLVLASDPFVRRVSDAERDRRIKDAWVKAGERLRACAQATEESTHGAMPLAQTSPTQKSPHPMPVSSPGSLAALAGQWEQMKSKIPLLRSSAETDLPDAIMDLVFQIEQQTAAECGEPQGADLALLLISRNRDAADQ